jgi:uncharacterized protein YgbK (DUF1537 family)
VRTRAEAVLVVDAVTENDLLTIARAAVRAGLARLTSGSAGLANAMAEAVGGRRTATGALRTVTATAGDAPVLVVAGSRNPLTRIQLSRAAQNIGLGVLPVDAERLAMDAEVEIGRVVAKAGLWLSDGHSVALSAADSPYVTGLSRSLAGALGEMAARLAGQHALAGLVLTGGDVALAACRALGTTALSLIGEVAPGIPLARIRGGPQTGLPLVTKAGGFGGHEAIITAILRLQGRRCS